MPDPAESRVAVYIDFDNIVISRYDQLNGRGSFHSQRIKDVRRGNGNAELVAQIDDASVDVSAILDYAASFGTPVVSRAYADWSVPVNADYRPQLLARAVDLTQLFPTTRGVKNGADIRLAVDVVEDLFRLPDLTHVVIVAGDSDYIALAQRARRLGRFVVGIGVAGSTSRSLAAACDEFADYDSLPGVPERLEPQPTRAPARRGRRKPGAEADELKTVREAVMQTDEDDADELDEVYAADPEQAAAQLLERALRVGHAKDDDEWLHANVVKSQMKRMDPTFNEKSLGYRTFTDFVTAHDGLADMREDGQARLIRLR
ncbi:NYN domain-containing protein [Epidermidibacterium keratini]|uniref:NYN domain-containing protein n=1 Tax=Epidermidibacterium keratini TaxID=1891644 RepID=A0A7L4YLU1_9ACTN|nr:NYN domain-containing protein [Epidermidibacterium keratini]QHB99516.1 NYN domain-containing protein [Epidermidibacterium keratini]